MNQEIKSEIARLSAEQVICKQQRKTVNLKGERTIDPEAAMYSHYKNRTVLRCLYIIYGELRGKSLDMIEPKRKTEPDFYLLEKLRSKYLVSEAVAA